MYIGPWQEYRLSRVSGGLEAALRNLDPAQALKALEALRPLLPADSLIEIEKQQQQQQQQLQQQFKKPIEQRSLNNNQSQNHKHGRKIIQRLRSNIDNQDSIIRYDYNNNDFNTNTNNINNEYSYNDSGQSYSNYSNNNNHYNQKSPRVQKLRSDRLPSLRTNDINPPNSVRSTKSEPIKVTKLKDFNTKGSSSSVSKSAGHVLPALTHKNLHDSSRYYGNDHHHHKQPPYNTAAVLNLLRLERDARELSLTTPKQPDFKGFWGWNHKAKNGMNNSCNNNGIEVNEWGDNADFEDSIDSHLVEKNSSLQPLEFKSKKEMVIAEKINRVKRMQQVYKEKDKVLETTEEIPQSSSSLLPSSKIKTKNDVDLLTSPIRISSPNVNDMELTDSELIQVSKYFKDSNSNTNTNTKLLKNKVLIPAPLKLDASPNNDSPDLKSNLIDLSRINSINHIIDNNYDIKDDNNNDRLSSHVEISDSPLPLSSSSSQLPSEYQMAQGLGGALDELFTGNGNATDNILRWSLSLDADNIFDNI